MSIDAYPLAWPPGWPSTPVGARQDGRGRFQRRDTAKGYGSAPWTFAAARDALLDELDKVSPDGSVLSSNFPLSRGQAIDVRGRPADQSVAIYFNRRGKPYVMACDTYARAEENMRSLALSLEALRQLERHGGGVMLKRAFAGFTALPAPAKPWELLGVSASATREEILAAWRQRMANVHPDRGGDQPAAAAVNEAKTAMLQALGA